jgi:magnesium transporter
VIHLFKVSDQHFIPALTMDEAFWIHLENPSPEEIAKVVTKYNLEEDFITDLQDADENARLEWDEGTLLTILRVPVYYKHGSAKISFATAPLGIITTEEKMITLLFNV